MSRWLSFVFVILFAACGSEPQTANESTQTPLQKMIKPQLDALEKAKVIEESLNQHQRQRDQELIEQGG